MFNLLIWLVGFALLWVPGFLISRLLRRRTPLAIQLAIGLSVWPLLLLWSSTARLRVSVGGARLLFAVLLIAGVALLVSSRAAARDLGGGFREAAAQIPRSTLGMTQWFLLAFLLALTIATRVSNIRNLVLPAWVDSVHHTAIVRLIVEQGRLPATYDPLIPQGVPYYHWGYHATVGWLCWVLGATDPFEIARVVLQYGQLLNALTVLLVYTAGHMLFRSRRAALFAATLAGLVSYFPAYFVSWGRYTHLGGLLVLLAFGPMLWRSRKRWLTAIAAAILAAGLILIHIRIAFFALTLAITLALFLLARRQWKFVLVWAITAVLALLLVAPWLVTVARLEQVSGIVAPGEAESEWKTPADIRAAHLWVPRNRELLSLATGGLTGILGWPRMPAATRILSGVLWILLIVCAERRARGKAPGAPWLGLLLLAVWIAITVLLINLDAFGLPPLQFASNTAAVISLFIPLSLAGGAIIAWISGSLLPTRLVRAGTALLIVLMALLGARGLRDVVNPGTVLASEADLEALKWIRANTPPDARFAIRARPWLGGSWVGTDGGYWISVLTGRGSTVPPVLYHWASPRERAREINFDAEYFTLAESEIDARMVWWMYRAGITHLYFGPRPGNRPSERFAKSRLTELVYDRGGVRIFRVRREPHRRLHMM